MGTEVGLLDLDAGRIVISHDVAWCKKIRFILLQTDINLSLFGVVRGWNEKMIEKKTYAFPVGYQGSLPLKAVQTFSWEDDKNERGSKILSYPRRLNGYFEEKKCLFGEWVPNKMWCRKDLRDIFAIFLRLYGERHIPVLSATLFQI